MRKSLERKPLAIFISDLHFWGKSPIFRSLEEDWISTMLKPFQQIEEFIDGRNIPVIIAGDIFDHYNPTPEVINRVMEKIPGNSFAVSGQHDLPNHNFDNIDKSGLYTLYASGKLTQIPKNGMEVEVDDRKLVLYGADWDVDIDSIEVKEKSENAIDILVCHKYIWLDNKTRYNGDVIPKGKISGMKSTLNRFDVAVFGDNHIPFESKVGKTNVVNCGTFLKRKSDEQKHDTGFVVLWDDLEVTRIVFNTEGEKYLKVTQEIIEVTGEDDANEFLESLADLEVADINFEEQVYIRLSDEKMYDKEEVIEAKNILTEIFNNFNNNK